MLLLPTSVPSCSDAAVTYDNAAKCWVYVNVWMK